MHLANNKKIYFASDQHFGAPTAAVYEEKSDSWHVDEVKVPKLFF
jgi:UDP-2,3-diacylglucosamine hydrolase